MNKRIEEEKYGKCQSLCRLNEETRNESKELIGYYSFIKEIKKDNIVEKHELEGKTESCLDCYLNNIIIERKIIEKPFPLHFNFYLEKYKKKIDEILLKN